MQSIETEKSIPPMEANVFDYLSGFTFSSRSGDLFPVESGKSLVQFKEINGISYPTFMNEFWTSKQRQASSLHEIAYRGCFKPQLPRFFIRLLSRQGDRVYDPFAGRGTTIIESGLMGRYVISNDINPLSRIMTRPRFFLPSGLDLENRLREIPINMKARSDVDISMFYHKLTEAELVSLRTYLIEREQEDHLDGWIRMVATNRLTGHSPGFFSVYTLPPNQAVRPENQIKINKKRRQAPEYRSVKDLILKKTYSLLRGIPSEQVRKLQEIGLQGRFMTRDARSTPEIPSDSIQLTVTSPPFLDVIQYSNDNWLRCWFNGISSEAIGKLVTMSRDVDSWSLVMQDVLNELFRITRTRGWVAFEVGEIRKGEIKLEEAIIPLGVNAGFECVGVLINEQKFTKTANIWGINNNDKGTNTNRIVLFRKN